MIKPQHLIHTDGRPAGRPSPIDIGGPRVPLYTEEFAADPHHAYRQMRDRYGPLAPVDLAPGVPATLVLGYRTALRILNDPDHFPADSRNWEKNVPADCPILPMLQWRPNMIRSAGAEHLRYRQVTVAAMDGVDQFALHSTIERIAIPLINSFCEAGTADLIGQYAFPLAFEVVNDLLGCPPEIGRRAAQAIASILDGANADHANAMLAQAIFDLVAFKRTEPGDDIITRLLQHPAGLDDTETVHQVLVFYGAGIEPMQNLITNTLRLMLTDDRFGGGLIGGSMSTRDALDEVLSTDPPMANYCVSFPRHPILIEGTWLPAHQPVVISMTACNNDPATADDSRTVNSSHLSWSVGAHACPARSAAYLVVQDAIDQLLDALPEMRLAIPAGELTWRPGPFHRALASLPVTFPKSPPLRLF
ncbi:cytochrome P450 [Nocardia brevicatena]|uniref:cytochrome P450 n=1 Tax=Nocardia brevicatena TaxID=37327 RepID=UPI0002D2D2F1|nr:cytochrome P450 [Nocardia brevicatena]